MINKSVNNPSKSFKVSSDNDDNQVHPNIKLPTDSKKDEMKQDTEIPVKSKISIPKSPEGNSSYLKSNEPTDNLHQHTNLMISSAQKTISASCAKQNEIISQNIPQQKNIPFDTQKTLTAVQVENSNKYQNPLSNNKIPVKSRISNPKSPEGNSYYLKSNRSTVNDNTELQTMLKLPTN